MSHRILIVDDSATIRAMIKRIIRMTGLEIGDLHEAGNGRIALDILSTTAVDLILADLNMPEMDGFEMTRRIHADPKLKSIPIIVISANPSAEDFAKLEHVSGFLGKPFTPESIRDAINKALEVQHA